MEIYFRLLKNVPFLLLLPVYLVADPPSGFWREEMNPAQYFYMVAGHQDTHPITPISVSADRLDSVHRKGSGNGNGEAENKNDFGALIRKKTGQTEYSFYQNVFGGDMRDEEWGKEEGAALERLRMFIPRFYPSLSEWQNKEDGASYVVMENILYPFIRAASRSESKSMAGHDGNGDRNERICILDLKLGSQLYEPSATAEKKEKMIKKSLASTSSSLGLRICGMRIRGLQYDRDYCLALKR